jgi:hypothetical protein
MGLAVILREAERSDRRPKDRYPSRQFHQLWRDSLRCLERNADERIHRKRFDTRRVDEASDLRQRLWLERAAQPRVLRAKPATYRLTVTPPSSGPFKGIEWAFIISEYSPAAVGINAWLSRK